MGQALPPAAHYHLGVSLARRTMLVGMVLGSFGSMMAGVQSVAMRYLGVMRSLVMVPRLMMLGGGAMMLRRVFMVLRGFVVMIDMVFGHGILSSKKNSPHA